VILIQLNQVLFYGLAGVFILLECIVIKKNYSSENSKTKKDLYTVLPLTTFINVGLVILGLIFSTYTNSLYAFTILIGMSIGLVGDFNNVSINDSTKCFIVGSFLFIMTYLSYSLALIHTSGGFIIPLDVIVITLSLFLYLFLLKSSWGSEIFHSVGKYKLITSFYPIMLIFLLSRALVNFFQSSLPLLSVITLTSGILLIFITDIEFSVDKFFKPVDKMIGPVLYPLGQLAIALSTILITF
jgi:hypothetical protein